MQNLLWLDRLLAGQGLPVDPDTLRAVEEWHRAWLGEWKRVQPFDLGDEDLPAPLWCWPP